MIIFKKADQIKNFILKQKDSGKTIGFVPTMGALHKGHLELVIAAKKSNDLVICSIFINPTQFNNPDDFKHYPNTIEKDLEQLVYIGCDVLFLPTVDEIYPADYKIKHYDLGRIENILEGSFRPGHFQGVCQVVERLLQIIGPHRLYLGQKDLQQCMVIKKLLDLLSLENKIEMHIIPTMREPDGLAMSSRNLRLDDSQRKLAPMIFRELNFIRSHLNEQPLSQLKNTAVFNLSSNGFVVDYIEIANPTNLEITENASGQLVALIAARIGSIRLIDNMLLN